MMTLEQATRNFEARFKRVETAPPESTLLVFPDTSQPAPGETRYPFVVVRCGDAVRRATPEEAVAAWQMEMEKYLDANPGREALYWRIRPELVTERDREHRRTVYGVYSRLVVL